MSLKPWSIRGQARPSTEEWTLQQFREALPAIIRTASSSTIVTASSLQMSTRVLQIWGVQVLRTPVRAPKANSVCERLGGSLRRECLDFLIPFHQRHRHMTVRDWAIHYNRGRPHSALGPGLPEPLSDQVPSHEHRHSLPIG